MRNEPVESAGSADATVAPQESFWGLIADSLDQLCGFKDHPERLLMVVNCLFAGLLISSRWVYGFIPAEQIYTDDGTRPSLTRLKLWDLSRAGILHNSYILRGNTYVVKYLLAGFAAITVFLAICVNIIGYSLIRDKKIKKE